jgi:hypothetical protein
MSNNDFPKLTPDQLDRLCYQLFVSDELVTNMIQPPVQHSTMIGRPDGTIGFGKFKGRPVASLDTNYLDWLLRTVKMDNLLRQQVIGALDRQ